MRVKEVSSDGAHYGWTLWCPGCEQRHVIPTGALDWTFNGDTERPTFSPSVKHTWTHGEQREPRCCHYFIKDGAIEFCSDSTHSLAGQTVPLSELPTT